MRIKILLKTSSNFIPYNYNYYLTSALYKLLQFGTPKFSEFLHNTGYQIGNKIYKLYSFALLFRKYQSAEKGLKLLSPYLTLIISSPIIEDFFKGILLGSFSSQEISLDIGRSHYILSIEQIEEIPSPAFSEYMKFTLLSPIIVSTMKEYQGKLSQYYLRADDDSEMFTEIINKNLTNKFELYHTGKYKGTGIKFYFDEEYIKRKKGSVSKKISLKVKGNTINLIGITAPFYIEGDPELIKVGYECGFGEKNSMGFGLAKSVK